MNLGLENPEGRENIGIPSHRDSKQLEEEATVGGRLAEDYNVSSDHYYRGEMVSD